MTDEDFKHRVINLIAETSVTLFETSDKIRKENRNTLGALWMESEFATLCNLSRELGIWKEVNQRYCEILKEKKVIL